MSEKVLSSSSFEFVHPDRWEDLARELDFVSGPTEGYQLRVEMSKRGRKTDEERRRVLAARSGGRRPSEIVWAVGREIRSPIDERKDEIAQLRAELEIEKAKNRTLAATVGTMEATMVESQVADKLKLTPWQERVKNFTSWLQRKSGIGGMPVNEIARERIVKMKVKDRASPIERPKPKAGGVVMATEGGIDKEDNQEIEKMRQEANRGLARRNRELTLENQMLREELELARKKNKELSRPAKGKSTLKAVAHGIGAILVLGALWAGSRAPISPSSKDKEEKPTQSPISQTLYSAPKPTLRVEVPSIPPWVAELRGKSQEKVVLKPSIEVVIPKGSWFWRVAEQEVVRWLAEKGLLNWTNPENGVRKSDVIVNLLVKDLKAKRVNFQGLSADQRFTFEMEENEEVMAAAQTKNFEDYQKLVASAGK